MTDREQMWILAVLQLMRFLINSLVKAGFVIDDQKSIWFPVQNIEWIVIMWNSIQCEISIPDRRMSSMKTI